MIGCNFMYTVICKVSIDTFKTTDITYLSTSITLHIYSQTKSHLQNSANPVTKDHSSILADFWSWLLKHLRLHAV